MYNRRSIKLKDNTLEMRDCRGVHRGVCSEVCREVCEEVHRRVYGEVTEGCTVECMGCAWRSVQRGAWTAKEWIVGVCD